MMIDENSFPKLSVDKTNPVPPAGENTQREITNMMFILLRQSRFRGVQRAGDYAYYIHAFPISPISVYRLIRPVAN